MVPMTHYHLVLATSPAVKPGQLVLDLGEEEDAQWDQVKGIGECLMAMKPLMAMNSFATAIVWVEVVKAPILKTP